MSNSIQRALNIQLGLASDDETPELGGDVEAVAETAAVAEGAVEVADATDEVVEADQTVDELSEAHENLEEVSEALEEAAANGGISQESARFAHLAIKAACGRFYSPAIASALPSVESFTGSSSRQRNTTIALESVGTMLRSFWDAIVRQIKKLWATVKNWYLKVLDAAPKLKKKAESLAKRSAEITGAPEEKTIDVNAMRQLHINGKAPSPSDAISVLKVLNKGADETLGDHVAGAYEKAFEDFETACENIAELPETVFTSNNPPANIAAAYNTQRSIQGTIKGIMDALDDCVSKMKTGFGTGGTIDGTNRFGTDVQATGSNELFGGRQAVLLTSTLKTTDAEYTIVRFVRNTGARLTDYKVKGKDVDGSGSFKTLSSSEIRSICDEISDICDSIITYKKHWEARDKFSNKMDATARKTVSAIEKDKDVNHLKSRMVKDVAMGMSTAFQSGTRFDTQVINYLLAVSRSMFTWVERSMAQYK